MYKRQEISTWIKTNKNLKSFIRNRQFGSCGEQNRKLRLRSLKGKLGLLRQFIACHGSDQVITLGCRSKCNLTGVQMGLLTIYHRKS